MTDSPGERARACSAHMHAGDYAAQMLGMSVCDVGPGFARLSMSVRRDMLNGHAVCHGGIVFALADTAFAHACNSYNRVSLAMACTVDYLQAVREGDTLMASARERSLRGRNGVYDVDVVNGQGDLVAVFRGKSLSIDESLIEE